MLINEVESIVGLSKKSIRLYESEGLIEPRRDCNNDYRIYTEDDVELLKKIKFLRELGFSIQEIRKIEIGELLLATCMKERGEKIDESLKDLKRIKDMCTEIAASNEEFQHMNMEKFVKEMNILNKRGVTMRDELQEHNKKILGAVFSTFIFSVFFVFLVILITFFQVTEDDKIPWAMYVFIMGMLFIPILGAFSNLIMRIKEIGGGEEDEASKY